MMKSNLVQTLIVIGVVIAFFAVIAVPPISLSLYFTWPFYVYEMVQMFWGMIVLVSFYGMLGAFK